MKKIYAQSIFSIVIELEFIVLKHLDQQIPYKDS